MRRRLASSFVIPSAARDLLFAWVYWPIFRWVSERQQALLHVAAAPTHPARTPLLLHRPRRPPCHLLRPRRLPRRSPPKIPRLRPPRFRRPLHHQNRNRNLRRVIRLCGGGFTPPSLCSPVSRDLIPAWTCTFLRLASTVTKAPLNALASERNRGALRIFSVPPANHRAFALRHKAPPRSTTSAPLVIPH